MLSLDTALSIPVFLTVNMVVVATCLEHTVPVPNFITVTTFGATRVWIQFVVLICCICNCLVNASARRNSVDSVNSSNCCQLGLLSAKQHF